MHDSTKRVRAIIDTKYKNTDLDKTINKNSKNLTIDEQNQSIKLIN